MKNFSDTTDDTSGVVIEADNEGFVPSQVSAASHNPTFDPSIDSSDALDALFKPTVPIDDETVEETVKSDPVTTGEVDPAEAKPADPTEPAEPAEPAVAAVATEKPAEIAPTDQKDAFSDLNPPPHAKPASRAAFDKIKETARAEISTLRTQIEELTAKVPSASAKIVTPELETELSKLRDFQRAHDYVNTSEFKTQYVKPLEDANAALDSKLKATGFSAEQIAEAKKIGYDKLDWDEVLRAVPAASRLSLSALLLNREQLTEKKAAALSSAQKSPTEYAAKQAEAEKVSKAEEEAAIITSADVIIKSIKPFEERAIPVNATDETRKQLEADNLFAREQKARFDTILKDRSPLMFGTLAASAIAAYRYQREAGAFRARAEKAEAELAKIHKSSSTARAARAAPSNPLPKRSESIFMDGGEALDSLLNEARSSRS